MNNNKSLPLILDGDLKQVFYKILTYFDPCKKINYKSKVLDVSTSYFWDESHNRLYDILKTNNLQHIEQKFHIIVYESLKNKKFFQNINIVAPLFKKYLNEHGIIICKITDFKLNNKIVGSFDIKHIFEKYNLILIENFIYKHNMTYNIKLGYSNFMIFKKCEN